MKFSQLIVVLLLQYLCFIAQAQDIHELNNKLGRGINYGNMFEAPSETAWGNPWQSSYPAIISDLGFNHVRIPIRWEPADRSSSTAPYTIVPTFLARIQEVVDATLENKMLAVINMHHHEAFFIDPDGQKDRFLSQWQQISAHFKNYPDSLVFEIMNEPHGEVTPEKWNEFLKDAVNVIRVDNPTRAVLIGTAEYGGLGGLPKLELPEDDNIIITIHYYNPFPFTHQGAEWVGDHADDWLGTEWLDTDLEREVVENEFSYLKSLSEELNIPVHIGEFGAYSTADLVSRAKWTTYLGRYFEEMGWSWAYWEFSAGFGVYNPSNQTYVDELVDALINNEMPEPATYKRTPLYTSNFTSGNDGWSLSASGGSSAQLSRADNALKVTISRLGTENWNIQLTRNNIALEEGKKYAFSFTGSATETRSASNYVGKNSDPWTQYGAVGVNLTNTTSSSSGVFDMNISDGAARFVFDLGASLEDVTITSAKIEELEFVPAGETPPVDPPLSVVLEQFTDLYPNPVQGILNFNNKEDYQTLTVCNVQGQNIKTVELHSGINAIDMLDVPKGLCFVRLSNGDNNRTFKLINE